jgi:hypothetical protein
MPGSSLRQALAVDKVWRDADGMKIEGFGNADNLMIDATLIEQGRPVVRYAAPPNARFQDFTAFEACLRLAASARGAGTLVSSALIPNLADQNSCAHWRSPMDMIFQGRSTSVFQA